MNFGVVMLAHEALDRAAEVAAFWARQGVPVVIHLDRRSPRGAAARFRRACADLPRVQIVSAVRCHWGGWSVVRATQIAAEALLRMAPEIGHVALCSGRCLPLAPAKDIARVLATHPETDFIEAASSRHAPWAVDGLDGERFTLFFPFSWRRQRRLFDAFVRLQRRLGIARRTPAGLELCSGSQWWCLTRATLKAILFDPRRKRYERFFRATWIPDESYFQTLARKHARRIESRSLTFSQFDFQGRPAILYDDHAGMLLGSGYLFARKVWPGAERLYATLVDRAAIPEAGAEDIHAVFREASRRRTRGRPGLVNAGRFPRRGWEIQKTAAPYGVVIGPDILFPDLSGWLTSVGVETPHARLFHPDGARFAGGARTGPGGLPSDPTLRDYAPAAFLSNLVRIGGPNQTLAYAPGDTAEIMDFIAGDPHASIVMVSGAWIAEYIDRPDPARLCFEEIAARQTAELACLAALRTQSARARVHIASLSEFLDRPAETLAALSRLGVRSASGPRSAPTLRRLDGLDDLLADVRDAGLKLHVFGDLPRVTHVRQGRAVPAPDAMPM